MVLPMPQMPFNRTSLAVRWLVAVVLICAATLAQAQYQAGREYVRLDPPRPVATRPRLAVPEFSE